MHCAALNEQIQKYIENGETKKSFKIEDNTKLPEYNDIWDRIKELLGISFIVRLFMMRNT